MLKSSYFSHSYNIMYYVQEIISYKLLALLELLLSDYTKFRNKTAFAVRDVKCTLYTGFIGPGILKPKYSLVTVFSYVKFAFKSLEISCLSNRYIFFNKKDTGIRTGSPGKLTGFVRTLVYRKLVTYLLYSSFYPCCS